MNLSEYYKIPFFYSPPSLAFPCLKLKTDSLLLHLPQSIYLLTLFIYLFIYFIYLFIYLSIYLFIYLFIYLQAIFIQAVQFN